MNYDSNQKDMLKLRKMDLYIPIILVLLYSMITIILYFLGPWDWPTKNLGIFSFLLIAYNFALGIGFIIGIKTRVGGLKFNISKINISKIELKNKRYIYLGIILFLFITILNCIRVTGLSGFMPVEYINEVVKGIKDPGTQYYQNLNVSQGNLFGGSILSYANVLLAPITWGVIPLSIYYFKELKFTIKFVVIFSILLECSRWVAIGTNKGIFDIAISIGTVVLIKSILNRYDTNRLKVKHKFTKIRIMVVLFFPIYFFVGAISDRLGGNISDYNLVINHVHINPDSFLMKITPEFLETTLILISSYVTQGYYAMSMASTLPFTPLFGIGGSIFLMENFKQLTGIDVFKYTYQTKLEEFDWDPFVNWHTMYTWLANDVSFIGVVFIMLAMGYMYALVWKDVLFYRNPIAIVLMCLFSLIFIFISSNNIVLSYPSTFTAFWGLTFIWVCKRKITLRFTLKEVKCKDF